MKEKIILTYSSSVVKEPIIYSLVKRFDIKVNILRAVINSGEEGSMLVELEADEAAIAKGKAYLDESGIGHAAISGSLVWKEEQCVHCGSCVGVCFSGALTMDQKSWELIVDKESCIACGLCETACPFACLSLSFGDPHGL